MSSEEALKYLNGEGRKLISIIFLNDGVMSTKGGQGVIIKANDILTEHWLLENEQILNSHQLAESSTTTKKSIP